MYNTYSSKSNQPCQYMPLIPMLMRQRQEDLCQLKASLVYTGSFRTVRITQSPCLKKTKNKTKKGKRKENDIRSLLARVTLTHWLII